MKKITRFSWMLIAVLTLVVVNSCKNEEEDVFSDNVFLLSAKKEAEYTRGNVLNLMKVASQLYPSVSQISENVVSGVVVYSVTYKTTFKGDDVVASGLIVVPDSIGDFPVLSFQNGTNTLYSEAPSENPFNILYEMIESVASMGFIVVIPDYIGFGSSKDIFHPYLHKESTVSSVLDMFRACAEFDNDVAKNITFLNRYFLMGYSQGGWSTLSLLESIDKEHSSEFNVAGCVCGAGPYDIKYFNSYILGLTEYPMPAFLGYIAKAYDDHDFFTNSLTDLIRQPYASNIETYFDGEHSTGEINEHLTKVIADLFTSEYKAGFETSPDFQSVRSAMTDNSIKAWNTSVPLLFIHGMDDVYVPHEISDNMFSAMNAASSGGGQNLKYIQLPGLDHTTAVVPACVEGLKFILALNE